MKEQVNQAWYVQVERGLFDHEYDVRQLNKRRARYAKRNATPKYQAKQWAYDMEKNNGTLHA